MGLRTISTAVELACACLLLSAAPVLAAPDMPVEPMADPVDYEIRRPRGERPWALTLYTVWLSADQLGDVLLFQSRLTDSNLWVAAVSRKLASLNAYVDAEVEFQAAKHGGPIQRHWEANGLGALRLRRFPWSNKVGTTLAGGIGLSYAFDDPLFEYATHEKSNKWLVYIMVELSLFMPSIPEWSLVARVHHRSAAYGTFENGLEGASNSAGLGLKYRF